MSWPAKTISLLFHLLLIVTPLIFLPSTSELFEFNKMVVVYLLTTLIVGVWIIRMLLDNRFIFRRTLLDIPLLLFLATQFLSLLFSIDPHTSWLGYYSRFNGGLLSTICYSLLYWSAVSNIDTKAGKSLLNWSVFAAIVVSIYGILQHFGIDAQYWVQDVQTRVFSTLGQPNWLAAYIAALIFIPISHKKVTLLHFALFTLLFFCLLFTKSRSGLLAFGLSSAVFWGLSLWQLKSKVLKPFLVFTAVLLTLILFTTNPIRDLLVKPQVTPSSAPVQSQGPALEVGGTESTTIRKIVWTGAYRIWRESTKTFWIGTGPETFTMAYYLHRPVEHNQTSEWELLYNKAHNEFLNYLSTTGILGLLSYLALLVAMCIILRTNYALLAGWLTIPVTNFWGFSTVTVQLLMFLLPALAIVLSHNLPPTTTNSKSTPLVLIPLFVMCFLSFLICKYWVADVNYASGQRSFRSFTSTQDTQDLWNSYQSFTSALALNPDEPAINSDAAISAAYMAVLVQNSTTSAQLSELAQTYSQKAITISPRHPNYYKNRSRVMILLSAIDPNYLAVADQALQQAQAISPTDPRIPYNRGIIAKYASNLTDAQGFFHQALRLKPDFADALKQIAEIATASGKIAP